MKNHSYMRKELAENTVGLLYDLKTGEVTQIGNDEKGDAAKNEL
jgi:carbonic anhydrase